jgi:hypothetical protein
MPAYSIGLDSNICVHERLRLYDIFRGVSSQSCQHEYIRVHGRSGSGSGSGSGRGSGNCMLMLGGLEVWDLKQTVTLLL